MGKNRQNHCLFNLRLVQSGALGLSPLPRCGTFIATAGHYPLYCHAIAAPYPVVRGDSEAHWLKGSSTPERGSGDGAMAGGNLRRLLRQNHEYLSMELLITNA